MFKKTEIIDIASLLGLKTEKIYCHYLMLQIVVFSAKSVSWRAKEELARVDQLLLKNLGQTNLSQPYSKRCH